MEPMIHAFSQPIAEDGWKKSCMPFTMCSGAKSVVHCSYQFDIIFNAQNYASL